MARSAAFWQAVQATSKAKNFAYALTANITDGVRVAEMETLRK